MKVGFYQFCPEFGNVKKNLEEITEAVRKSGADLMVFPELAFSGYLFLESSEVEETSDTVPGLISDTLSAVARETGTAVIAGFGEKVGDIYYNSALLATPDGRVETYRKNHLFNEEKLYFRPGDKGFPVFEINGVKIGILICFDHMFPESARSLALQGVQVICHPANLVLPRYAQITSCSRALENRVYWILANRCGTENRGGKSLSYSGCSRVVNPFGEVILSAGADDTGIFCVDIEPETALNKRLTPLCDLFEDRRADLYKLITE